MTDALAAPSPTGALPVRRYPVDGSSTIKAVAYDLNTQILEIDFHSGGRYAYAAVPPDIPARILFASSAGRVFALYVKGKFEFRKVAPLDQSEEASQ